MVFLPCFFLFLKLAFHFQSLLNEFVFLKNTQHLQEYSFSFFCFLKVQTYKLIYLILIFCIWITGTFQLFYLTHFFVQNFLRYLFHLMVSSVSRFFGIFFFKNILFLPCFFLFLQLNFYSQSLLNQFLFLKNAQHVQEYCFFATFFQGTNIYFIFCYLDFLYLDNQQFLAILFDLFFCTIFLRCLFYLMVSSV